MESPSQTQHRDYDRLAWFYNRHWDNGYHALALSALEHIGLQRVPAPARVLDLCCGTGHLTRMLSERGYQVTGLDGSEPMLRFARGNLRGADFIAADVRSFSLRRRFQLVLSTFESLNHIRSLPELRTVFQNVRAVLQDDGWFIFDMLREAAYEAHWHKGMSIVEDDNVCILRGGYDSDSKLGRAMITMFRREESWERSDVTIVERCYPERDVIDGLSAAGFQNIELFDAVKDLGLRGDLATGRLFYLAGRCTSNRRNP